MKNLMEKIKNTRGNINRYYSATVDDFCEIINNSRSLYDVVSLGFRFGYLQGRKAAIAEMKKKARAK